MSVDQSESLASHSGVVFGNPKWPPNPRVLHITWEIHVGFLNVTTGLTVICADDCISGSRKGV